MVGTWEYLKKQGLSISDELTDAIQISHTARWDDTDTYSSELSLGWRISIREFSRASDLPLVPGKYGPLVYTLGFIAIAIGALPSWP